MKKYFTDRSRTETAQRCLRRRWLEYSEGGMGTVSKRKSLPLAVGGAVHSGLEVLVRDGNELYSLIGRDSLCWMDVRWRQMEEAAVSAALADFATHSGALELDTTESAAMIETEESAKAREEMIAQAVALGMDPGGLGMDRGQSMNQFDGWLYAEQSALVEAMVRAYSRRRLRPLLEQFEVLEVEREGEWKLSEWLGPISNLGQGSNPHSQMSELWFMSRPDALLRERSSNELYLLSFKTTASWDVRKAKSIERDMQGLSEGVEIERRLGEWYRILRTGAETWQLRKDNLATFKYLESLQSPPRIHAIRYEFLLKGDRWEDKDLSAKLGMTVRTQRSHLIRRYVAHSTPKKGDGGYSVGDACWSWEFTRPEDSTAGKLAWQNWKSEGVWDSPGGVRAWIDALDASEQLMSGEDSTIGMEPRVLGWKSPAQAMGVTGEHPLDAVFLPPVVVYRNDDELRDWVEQVEAQEVSIATRAEEVQAAGEDERRSLLNRYFPQNRQSCFYPGPCNYVGACWAANSDMKENPLASGLYQIRVPNHPQEKVVLDSDNNK